MLLTVRSAPTPLRVPTAAPHTPKLQRTKPPLSETHRPSFRAATRGLSLSRGVGEGMPSGTLHLALAITHTAAGRQIQYIHSQHFLRSSDRPGEGRGCFYQVEGCPVQGHAAGTAKQMRNWRPFPILGP